MEYRTTHIVHVLVCTSCSTILAEVILEDCTLIVRVAKGYSHCAIVCVGNIAAGSISCVITIGRGLIISGSVTVDGSVVDDWSYGIQINAVTLIICSVNVPAAVGYPGVNCFGARSAVVEGVGVGGNVVAGAADSDGFEVGTEIVRACAVS